VSPDGPAQANFKLQPLNFMISKQNHSMNKRNGVSPRKLLALAGASVLLLCAAGNVPVENFTPQGPMQADLNAGGHNLTNAGTIYATNVVVSGSLTGNGTSAFDAAGSAATAQANAENASISLSALNAGTLNATSTTTVPSEETVSAYVLANAGGSAGWTLIDNSGSSYLSSTNLTGGKYLVDLGSIAASGNAVTLDPTPTDDETVVIRDLNFGAGNGFGGTYGALNIAYTSNSITPDGAGGTTVYYTALTTAGETATFVWSAALDTWVEHQVMPASGYVAPTWTPVNSGDFIQLNPGGFYAVTAATGDGVYGPQPGVNVGDTIYIWDAANCLAAQGTDFDSVGGSNCAVFQNGAEANASSYPPVAFGTVPPYPVYKLIWDGTEWIQYLDGTNNP